MTLLPRTLPRALALSGAALALGACATMPAPQARPAAAAAMAAPPPELSPDRRLSRAIDMLQHGRADAARKELEAVTQMTVNNKAAGELLHSLDADPADALGRTHFGYTTQAGDTMMSLSARFLHDPLKFYLLARYNGIEDPSALAPGRTLMIPRPERAPAVRHPAVIAQRPAAAAEPPPAIAAAPPPVVAPPAGDPARAHRLRAAGLEALDRGEVRRAVGLLEAASAADPTDSAVQRDLARARRIAAAVASR